MTNNLFLPNGLLIQWLTNVSTGASIKEFLLPLAYKDKGSYAVVGTVNFSAAVYTHLTAMVGKLDGRKIIAQVSYATDVQAQFPFSVFAIGF
ncbi:gp53-like domain-containing protein [Treponema sp.]|uniref:gp53-like domain-containing protein n=1 Tax=Treponema sp. TaxID=166 RepID=UPI003FA1B26A